MSICIISNKSPSYSETFIRAHLENLPASEFIYGHWFPNYSRDGKSLVTFPNLNKTISKLDFKIKRRFLNQSIKPIQARGNFYERLEFKTFIKRKKINLVLAEYGPTAVAVSEICHQLNVPIITHFHGYDAYTAAILDKYGKSYSLMFRQAAAIIAVSKHMENQLFNLGADRKKVHYCPYGVDTSLFKHGKPDLSPPVFIGVGRLVEKKAPHLTIKAFQAVHERIPDAKLILVGDGPLMGRCQELLQKLCLNEVVDIKGACSHAEVSVLMQKARAFVQHSMTAPNGDSEGTPVSILEAGASGLPVVSTRHAGITDVVLENETGFLVDEGDVSGMSNYMLQLAKSPQLAAEQGQAARLRICSNFSMNKSISRLRSIIDSVV